MQRTLTIAFICFAVLGGTPPAAASNVLTTPMLTSSNVGNGRSLECRWVNVSRKTVTVSADLVASDGTVAATTTPCGAAPGAEGCVASLGCGAPSFVCRAYCRFTGAGKSKIRGSIILTPPSTGDALVALPAQ